ncbi:MAG: hypothetical protein FJ117_05820 [Deltaproteobacteria bacterium]|nr:hypothetical protein [Deltaproteobacteria bacterium]
MTKGRPPKDVMRKWDVSSTNWKGSNPCAIFIPHLLGEEKVERDDLNFIQCSCHPRRCFHFLPNLFIADQGPIPELPIGSQCDKIYGKRG